MGRVPTYNRQYEVQHMWERHHEIVRMTLLGMSPTHIAEKLHITNQTVSNTLNSKIVRDKLQILRAERDASSVDVASAIKNLAPKCIEAIDGILTREGVSDAVRLNAAKDILDRNGHAAPKVIQTQNIHGVFSKEDLIEMKANARALAMESGIIEAEVVDE